MFFIANSLYDSIVVAIYNVLAREFPTFCFWLDHFIAIANNFQLIKISYMGHSYCTFVVIRIMIILLVLFACSYNHDMIIICKFKDCESNLTRMAVFGVHSNTYLTM